MHDPAPMHPWHDIELGNDAPEHLPVVIETPAGSKAKLALDPDTGLLKLKRVMFSAAPFPAHSGFVPRTLGTDDDPLDVLVYCQQPLPPLTLVGARVLGGIALRYSSKGREDKLIAVPEDDPAFSDARSVRDLPRFQLDELEQFYGMFKELEGDRVEVREVFGRTRARQVFQEACRRYLKRYPAAA